jgi:hypothetical protein
LLNGGYMKRLVLLGTLLAGCGLFTGSGDDQKVCPVYNGGAGGTGVSQGFRDPTSGNCTYDSPPPPDCGDPDCPCYPTPLPNGIVVPKTPIGPDAGNGVAVEGGECNGPCSGLDEQSCLANDTCHASYLDSGTGTSFWSCWDITPEAPQPQACAGLDAYSCAVAPNCSSLFNDSSTTGPEFESCVTNSGSGCDCASGYHCVDECNAIDCIQGSGCGCTPTCVPDDPTCSLPCPPGATCMEECGPNGSCQDVCVSSTLDPGQCTGTISCNSAPPACPVGTTAGIENGCWTGYCIPNADCPAPACAAITDQASCTARPDCEAVYAGMNCTCDASGCTCTVLTFERCEAGATGGSGI